MQTFRALRHRRFALLMAGQTVSRTGDYLYQVALAWWVLQKTGSATQMGLVLLCTVLPTVAFLLVGGVIVDRMPRARLIFWSDLGRAAVMAGLTAMEWSGSLEVWSIFAASLLFGVADAVFAPAMQALVPQVVPQDDLPSGNAVNSLSAQFGRIAGPALGGLLIAWNGAGLAFAVNAASFVAAAIAIVPLLAIPAPARTDGAAQGIESVLADVRDGFRTVVSTPLLWIPIVVFAFGNVALSGPYSVGMPFLVDLHLKGDEELLGFLYMVFPVGYAIASLLMGSVARIRRRGVLFCVAGALAGLGLAAFGTGASLYLLVAAAVVNGAALEVEGLTWTSVLQERVPEEKLGRVASFDSLGSYALLPVGYAVTGWLIDAAGPAPVFVGFGCAAAAVSLVPLFSRTFRRLD
ncbi:MAG: Enterobactin exporter EntS [Planctomycetes bacterium]|nr:Enterobactin exporter EntS [Planctomycetota bacterium]